MATDDAVEAKDAWKCCGCRKQTLYKYFSECDACWHAACDGCIRKIIIDDHDYWLCPCCRWWAGDVNNTSRDDTHAGAPPLVAVRYVVSAAGSYPDAGGEHFSHIGVWDVRKAYFNAPLDELFYLHPGAELCPKGYCWRLKKALYGTRKASTLWQQTVIDVLVEGGWSSSQAFPSTFYKPKLAPEDEQPEDGTLTCHGDDFLAEGSTAVLDELGDLLNGAFETKTFDYVGPTNPGELAYLKRTVGYTDQLPESDTAGFYWCANGKMIEDLIEKKGYKKSS
jgi:hypothetical protein